MSLPTRALFLDEDGNVIATQQVNVGWLTEQSLFDVLVRLPKVKDVHKVTLYGCEFPGKFFTPNPDIEGYKENLLQQVKFGVDKFNQVDKERNNELRNFLKELFIKEREREEGTKG